MPLTLMVHTIWLKLRINLIHTTDNQYFTKRINNTSNITNDIRRHDHSNYEHNVIKKVNNHIKHINNYDTEINYYSKESVNSKKYCNFYNDTFDLIKIENISLSQQTDITNGTIEISTQTVIYIGNNYLNNNKIATVTIAPTSLTENYSWIPGTTDNVVPGLES